MSRKFTATMFLMVMTLLITLKHPVLGYCMCVDSFFTGNCACQVEKATSLSNQVSDTPAPHCCANCESTAEAETSATPEAPLPCNDCTERLSLDTGDFVWNGSTEVPSNQETLLPPTEFAAETHGLKLHQPRSITSIRGSPPPDVLPMDFPVYLRHLSLRL